jgi:hypothetical protein
VAASGFLGRVIRIRVDAGEDFCDPISVEVSADTKLELRPGTALKLFVSKFRGIDAP